MLTVEYLGEEGEVIAILYIYYIRRNRVEMWLKWGKEDIKCL